VVVFAKNFCFPLQTSSSGSVHALLLINEVLKGKNLPNTTPVQNCMEQDGGLLQFLFNFALDCAIRNVKEN
jgi:hypothetical protein